MDKRIEIDFGVAVPRISEQLSAQGIRYDSRACIQWQRDAEALLRLYIRGMLPAGEMVKARRRIMRRIVRELESNGRREAKK